jgi:lantibiotic transport system ATP-binding protein
MNCIETKDLWYRYRNGAPILKGIDLQVPMGAVYGFLGPNGAGKSTTLRLLLGLLKKQKGEIHIFCQRLEENRISILQKTGSLIDSPSVYAHLSAMENLMVLQQVYGTPKSRMQEVLDLTGIGNTGKKKAGMFSLGMKQRLSVAIALLNDPSLLILDEPTNGLDPSGITEMRDFLRRLNQEQKITIVISSHLLAEIEKVATHVGVIHHGSLLFQGTLDALMQMQEQTSAHVLETSDNTHAAALMNTMGLAARIENGKIVMPVVSKDEIARVSALLTGNSISVYGITIVKSDLEKIFIDLTKN